MYAHMGHSRTPSGCSVISFTSSILSEPISENYPHSEPETDVRGYEIADGDTAGDASLRDDLYGQDRAYEADDESGYDQRKHKVAEVTPQGTFENGTDDLTGDNIDQRHQDGESLDPSSTQQQQEVAAGGASVAGRPGILKNTLSWKKMREDRVAVNGHAGPSVVFEADSVVVNGGVNVGYSCADPAPRTSGAESDSSSAGFQTANEDSDPDGHGRKMDKLSPRFIDSVHHGDFISETLSQYSTNTAPDTDIMSTLSTAHSSLTLGDPMTLGDQPSSQPGEHNYENVNGDDADSDKGVTDGAELEAPRPTISSVETSRRQKGEVAAVMGRHGNGDQRSRVDKASRTLTWVQEAQTRHFSDQVNTPHIQ